MITLLLLLLPLSGVALMLLFKPLEIKKAALSISLITFLISLIAYARFDTSENFQFMLNYPWVVSAGISFSIGLDGLSLLLVLLTSFLIPLIILSTFGREYKNPFAFYGLILLMETALIGVFAARDAFLFYVFWEFALIPAYFISLLWGGNNRHAVTFKFFIYTLFGSLLMLFTLIYLYLQTPGEHSFAMDAFYNLKLNKATQSIVFWGIFISFAIKMPIFPFHTWQPSTYRENSTAGTMLLSGLMLKMGIFGILRWIIPVIPEGAEEWAHIAILLSVLGIIYASCIAIIQKDFKLLLAYASIAHVGLIAAGIFSFTDNGIRGGIIQMFTHGVNVVGLFFVADIISQRTQTFQMDQLGGIRSQAPYLSTAFMIILAGSIGLPLTNGFVGESLLLLGLFQYNAILAGFAGLTIILGATYMLLSYQKTMLGDVKAGTLNFADLSFSEKIVMLSITLVIILSGCYPKPLLMLIEPSVKHLLIILNQVNSI